jgi:zinc transport system permease protein
MPHAELPSWESFWSAWELFRDPLLCAFVAGTVLGFLGVYVLLRRMVFVSAAVSQFAGFGVALAFYLQIHYSLQVEPAFAAAGMSLAATLVFSTNTSRLQIPRETLLGLAFALAGGGAVMLGDRIAQEAHDIQSILFGTAVLVRELDLKLVLWAGLLFGVIHLWWFRGITFASFDPEAAQVQGLPVGLLNGIVFVSVGAMVGVSSRALGALPVFAFSALPAAAALLLGVRMQWAFVLAAIFGAISGVGGYLVAYFYEFPVGGSQTVVAAVFALLALLFKWATRGR